MNRRALFTSLSVRLIQAAFLQITVALFVGLASAQVAPLQCTTNTVVTPVLRGEGYSELVGDIAIVCTGGAPPTLGSVIPQVNVQILFNTAVTSRLLPGASGAVSEALLLIDEPGSGLPPNVPNFGPAAGQNLCASPLQGCVEYVSQATGSIVPVATDTPQGTSATTNGKNVFRGIVSSNSVTFYGIPLLAPGETGSRVFRLTNVRVNANALYGGSASSAAPVQATVSISGATSVALSNPTPYVGYVSGSLTTGVSGFSTFSQCISQSLTPVNNLSFAEAYGSAFKTRVMAQNNLPYSGQNGTPGASGFPAQNVPGAIYNSESGIVLPVAAGQVAGLADFGTRLKAQFSNLPSGVRLFVSVSNVQNNGLPVSTPAVIGGNAANTGIVGFAQLTANENDVFAAVAATSSAPVDSGSVPVAEIPIVNGAGTAVWEVVNTNPNANETFKFSVFTTYTANPGQNSPPPGIAAVSLSYAPTPPNFTASSGAAASATLPVPRFISDGVATFGLLMINTTSCPRLSSSATDSGNFTPGQTGATCDLTVFNFPDSGTSSGTVTVANTLSSGLTATSIGGTGWSCTLTSLTCTRDEQLVAGASYPPISITMNVGLYPSNPQSIETTVSGGNSASAGGGHLFSTLAPWAVVYSPVPGSTLTGPSALFQWNPGLTADQYWLDIGTSIGGSDVWRGSVAALTQLVTGLPCDGRTLYAQLFTHTGNAWSAPQRYTYGAATCSRMTVPIAGAVLPAPSLAFMWTTYAGEDQYWLDVGTTVGGSDIARGSTTGNSFYVASLPCDGRAVYAQLFVHTNGAWLPPIRYTYTAASGCVAVISSPVPGTTLSSTSVGFVWNPYSGADQYWLDVGSTVGGSDIARGATTETFQRVNGLPCDGRTVYAQFFTHISGAWQPPQRYTYTAPSGCIALLNSPTPGTVLPTAVLFSWNSALGADQYWLDVGSAVGTGDIWRGALVATAQAVTDIPCDGRTVYAQLYTRNNGTWLPPQRYTYTAPAGCFAQIISPAPGALLPATTVTFTWNTASGVDQYWLDVGSAVGTGDIWRGALTGTSQSVTVIPCDARTLYVQLYSHRNGVWLAPARYTYTAPGGCVAQILSPTPGTILTATSVPFTWAAAAGADQYWLDVGSTLGGSDLWRGALTATSQLVAGLPCDRRTVYVQLFTHTNGAWQYAQLQRYTYTARPACGP
jgi:hypothetical protein